jgi:predicted N-acetyltransferase YhbS
VAQLKLRAANLLDITRIEQIYRDSVERFSEVPPPARLWGLVSQTLSFLLPLSQETLIYVAEDGGKVVGFVQASGQPLAISLPAKITALHVLNLCVAGDVHEGTVASGLVEHLVEQAGSKGVNRLFVRIPLDDPLIATFRAEGFRQYATESVLYAEQPEALSAEPPAGLRTAGRKDDRRLYHLYRKVTPMGVAHLEAPTYKAWKALRTGPGQQEVVDRVEIVGWCRVHKSSAGRPHTLSFMALPESGLAEELADHAIVAADGQPAWSSLRHYDAHLVDALRGRGFTVLLTQALLVRDVTVTVPVPEQRLVPAFG